MKRITAAALAALALAALLPTTTLADEPANPVQGAVCNLYWLKDTDSEKQFSEQAAALPSAPAAATFVDSASDFSPSHKKDGIESVWGMWTGWLKQEKAGIYTFTCHREQNTWYRYAVWINDRKCIYGVYGQSSFNVELTAGYNSVKIIAEGEGKRPLTITYKKAGSVKEPVSFGPENMFYEDEE